MPRLVRITPGYPLNRTLDGFQRRSGRSGEEKSLVPAGIHTTNRPARG